jgi:hypothetical protein
MTDSLRLLDVLLAAAALTTVLAVPAHGQHPTAVTSIANSNADTAMEVNYNGSLLMPGNYNPTAANDSIPATGAGTRLMWYPAKAAFRAGRVQNKEWDPGNVGKHSVAFGVDNRAKGFAATALGTEADATGGSSLAVGFFPEASGGEAVAMGRHVDAATSRSLTIGTWNDANTSEDNTLFVAGNGDASNLPSSRSDALVLKKDGDLGLGPSSPNMRLHVTKNLPNEGVNNNPAGNMVLFTNTNGDPKPDVMGLRAGPSDPGSGTSYLSFYQLDGTSVGAIKGDGSGGVNYTSAGADFAEKLPVSDGAEVPEAADVVGVRSGEVSLRAEKADRAMVVSTAPIMTGNATPSTRSDDERRVPVAFVGQVPAKVRGAAEVGDLVVPSGRDDGTARAVSPSEYRRMEHGPIVGQAWSPKASEEIGEVTVAVGLGRSGAVAERMEDQRDRIAELEAENEALKTQQQEIKNRLAALEAERSPSVVAGLAGSGTGLLLAFLLGGLLGAGLIWRRQG